MPTKIKVFLVDDHPIVREGIKHIINTRSHDISVVGEASNGKEALDKAATDLTDIYMMDIIMPFLNGIETAERLIQIDSNCKIIILTRHHEKCFVERALKAGVRGYITKECDLDEILRAIREVYLNKYFLCPPVAKHVINGYVKQLCGINFHEGLDELTNREKEILQLIGEGIEKKQIAKNLNLSLNTVLVHKKNIMQKLEIHRQSELIRYAIKEGFSKL